MDNKTFESLQASQVSEGGKYIVFCQTEKGYELTDEEAHATRKRIRSAFSELGCDVSVVFLEGLIPSVVKIG